MAIGKISGTMLQANLERQGTNLSIDATAYFDVTHNRLGVNNSSPQYTLDVTGNAHVGNLYIQGNAITTDAGYKLNLGSISNINISGGSPNYVIYTDGNGNLTFGDIDALPEVSAILANINIANLEIAGANAAIVTANNAVVSYVNYLNSQMISNVTAANAAIVTANTAVVGYVNYLNSQMASNVAGANAAIVTANNAVVSYVNTANSAVVSYVNYLVNNISTGGNANIAAFLSSYTGNIHASNLTVSNVIYGNVTGSVAGNVTGYVLTSAQPYITQLGNLSSLVVNTAIQSNTITANSATLSGNLSVGNITITGNTFLQNLVVANLDLNQGNIISGNVISNFYGNISADVITPYHTPITVFSSNSAVGVPVGNTAQQPANPVNGYLRYNTDLASLEVYGNNGWMPLNNEITSQPINCDGVNATFTLNQASTQDGILVSINGTVQQPGVAYTVSGNQITFSQVPTSTDVVDVRYIATTVSFGASVTGNLSITGNLTIGGLLSAPQSTKLDNSTGVPGQIAWDSNYIYVCTATNTWKRVSLTSF